MGLVGAVSPGVPAPPKGPEPRGVDWPLPSPPVPGSDAAFDGVESGLDAGEEPTFDGYPMLPAGALPYGPPLFNGPGACPFSGWPAFGKPDDGVEFGDWPPFGKAD